MKIWWVNSLIFIEKICTTTWKFVNKSRWIKVRKENAVGKKKRKKDMLTNGRDEGRVESILGEPEEDARLADPWVTNQQQLEQIIIRLRHTLCSSVTLFISRDLFSHFFNIPLSYSFSPLFKTIFSRVIVILGIPMTHPLNLKASTLG